jgi:glyoxylate/hydroxypyruvate reductase A
MAILVIAPGMRTVSWVKHLKAIDPDLDIRIWPESGKPEEIEFALVWRHPPGELRKYPNLRCIASLGAGVDHILRDPDLPAGVPISRVVDRSMARSMTEYVVLSVLNYCRHFEAYRQDQLQRRWKPRIPRRTRDVRIGIMGLGQLGGHAAATLVRLGFQVRGWSRTGRRIEGVISYADGKQLDKFLSATDILVCLLPLTQATERILSRRTFAKLPPEAYVINAARGRHLVEEDLLEALESGHLSGACLDVFQHEPLPPEHPFWRHPKITVTPHISSLTDPKAVAPQLVENYRRARDGKPLLNLVDMQLGY